MDTELTINEIELAIVNSTLFNKRTDIFVPNVSWGLLNHEADLVIMTKSGYLTEIEIKRSWEDFKADFDKVHGHHDDKIFKLYFCVPISILEKVVAFLKEKFDNAIPAVITYDEHGNIKDPNIGYPGRGGRKLFLEEQLTIARLGCMRVWNLKKKLVDVYHENKQHKGVETKIN